MNQTLAKFNKYKLETDVLLQLKGTGSLDGAMPADACWEACNSVYSCPFNQWWGSVFCPMTRTCEYHCKKDYLEGNPDENNGGPSR